MSGPETLHAQLTSGNPATIAGILESLTTSMTSLDSSADSLVLATSGVEWQGTDREAFNDRIWATAAAARMAHARCSQGKVAARSVHDACRAVEARADLIIEAWRVNRSLPLDGPALAEARNRAMAQFRELRTSYQALLLAATDYLPTDGLAQHGGDQGDWEEYLAGGGLSDAQREALEKGLGYSMTRDTDEGVLPGPVIPDTEITGNDDRWVPQGIGYSPANGGTVVQVAYNDADSSRALASIIDPDTGELLNSVVLENPPKHVGGVVVDGNDVWVTGGSSPSRVTRYSLDDLRNAAVGTQVKDRGYTELVKGGHSFSTIHTEPDGTTYLYAGDFWNDRMYRYEKVGDGWERDSDYVVKTPEFTQGVVVTDGEISFSTSYTRGAESEVKTYDRNTLEGGGDADDEDGLLESAHLPNMSEGMTLTPDGLAVLHESGADAYLGTGDEWVSPFMTLLRPGDVSVTGQGIEVDPATLRQAAHRLGDVEGELQVAARAIYGLHLPAWALGQVDGAADFATALNLHLDATGIWLKRSEISAGISVDGLLGSAEEHERADTTARDLYENAREAWEDTKDFGGDVKDGAGDLVNKGKDVYDDVTPWDGALPG